MFFWVSWDRNRNILPHPPSKAILTADLQTKNLH